MKPISCLSFLGLLSFAIGCEIRDEQAEKLGRNIGSATESSKTKEIKNLNDTIVADYNRVQNQFNKIQLAYEIVNNGGYKDATPLKQVLADLRKSAKTAKSRLKAVSVPEGANAKPMIQAFQEFLDEMTNLTDRVFPPLVAIMENDALTKSQKHVGTGQKWLDAAGVVGGARISLKSSQSFFAMKHKLDNKLNVRGR